MARSPSKDKDIKKNLVANSTKEDQDSQDVFSSGTAKISSKKI